MATYVNDLRLKEIATGDESGTWGASTNTNLELIAEAFSFGTEAITTNADTHTTTIADGSTDPGRSIFLKYTGTLDSTCTITIGPNTVSKLWLIENATSGGFSIIIKQGSGATVTVPNGQTKAIYSDGAGSGGAMVDAFQDLSIPDLFIDDDLTFTSDSAVITFGADGDTTLTHTDGSGLTLNSTNKLMFNDASQFIQGSSATVLSLGATDEIDLTATAIDVNGTIDVSGAATFGSSVTSQAIIATNASGTPSTINGAANNNTLQIFADTTSNQSFGLLVDAGTSSSDYAAEFRKADNTTIMRIRGDGNVGIGTSSPATELHVDGKILTAGGSASSPALQLNDVNSGLYSAGGNTVAISTDGVERVQITTSEVVFNDPSNDVDFRVESNGNTHMLFVDAGSDHVNIGTSTDYDAVLNVQSTDNNKTLSLVSTDTDANAGPVLALTRQSSSSAADGDILGRIDFEGLNDANQQVAYGRIQTFIRDASDGTEDGTVQINHFIAGSEVNALELDNDEYVFNNGSNDVDFRVESNGNTHALFVDAGNDTVVIGSGSITAPSTVDFLSYASAAAGRSAFVHGSGDGGVVVSGVGAGSAASLIFGNDWGSDGSGFTEEYRLIMDGSNDSLQFKYNGNASTALTLSSAGVATFGSSIITPANGVIESASSAGSLTISGGSTNKGGQILLRGGNGDSDIVFKSQASTATPQEVFRVGPSETVVNEGSVDYDFRVESNADANAFFVNGGDGVVSFGGMGTNTRSPSGVQPKFQANSLTRMDSSISLCCNSNDALASLLMFSKTRSGNLTGATAAQAGDAVGAITWNAADGTDIEHGIAAIDAVVETGIGTNDTPGAIRFYTNSGTTAASEKMRLNAAGDLQVATTDTTIFNNTSGGGINLMAANRLDVARAGDVVATFNRMSDDGQIIQFYQAGSQVGSIKCRSSGANLQVHTDESGIDFGGDGYLPMRGLNIVDNDLDIGSGSFRYDDIFATNGTIQTSDRNEKQDIEELSDAEQRVAVAAKSLLRKYRYKSAVEEKGDDARIHFGIIAQDLQDAFTTEGLDAARYAMFCSDTWWEAQIEVAATEATETSPAIEAHTRTDRFDTAEEAPEGAVQRTRLGVRYSELLAFIISAI